MSDAAILHTDRLTLRRLQLDDAGFIVQLLNDPDWLRFIGDKGVRTLEDARDYLRKGPLESYAQRGFGLWLVVLRGADIPIGMCGLIKRDTLDDVDIGFAFLPQFRGRGFAHEAAAATLAHARDALHLTRVVAITSADNAISGKLLAKLGLEFERMIRLGAEDLKLFATRGP